MKIKMASKNAIILTMSILLVVLSVGLMLWQISGREYGLFNNPGSKEQSTNGKTDSSLSASKAEADSNNNSTSSSLIKINALQNTPDDFKVELVVKKAYEIRELLAVESFKGLEKVSVNRVVQYAFCYLYSAGQCLVDYKTENMVYRSATRQQIEGKIIELFGSCPLDVTKSELYNAGSKCFEMWQPNYRQPVFGIAEVATSGDAYIVTADYFADAARKNKTFSSKITVIKKDGNYIIINIS